MNTKDDVVTQQGDQAQTDLATMIAQGRSFSGRERNCCFLNPGATAGTNRRFANISAASGLDHPDDARAIAVVDWDQDGDQDIWTSNRSAPRLRFMRNDAPTDNHFLALRLQGNGTDTNRDAIGARVEVILKAARGTDRHLPLIKTLRAGEGYLAQSSKWLHFGLGAVDAIQKVIVRWPAGSNSTQHVEQFSGLKADGRYRLVQGRGKPLSVPRRKEQLALRPSSPKPLPSSSTARIPCVTLLPMKTWTFNNSNGDVALETGAGRSVLLNLWASWCRPCIEELLHFKERAAELREAGLEIVCLSVDGLGDKRADLAAVQDFYRLMQLPFVGVPVSEPDVAMLQTYHDVLLGLDRPLPIPSSFLIDGDGRLSVIYKGPVSVDQLLIDMDHSRRSWEERWAEAAAVAGRSIEHERTRHTADRMEATTHLHHAKTASAQGWTDVAIADYREVNRLVPGVALAHRRLGNLLYRKKDFDQAGDSYKRAIAIDAGDELAHNNLGLILQKRGQLVEALAHFQRSITVNPDYLPALRNVGRSFAGQGKWSVAADYYQRILEIDPHDQPSHNRLAQVYVALDKLPDAQQHYERAIELNPDDESAHLGVADVLMKQGLAVEGANHYRTVLSINANHLVAKNNLAWLLATHQTDTVRDGEEATRLASELVEATAGNHPYFLDTLAAAQAEAGRYDDAIQTAGKAISIAQAAKQQELAQKLETRLRLYKRQKPYRQSER